MTTGTTEEHLLSVQAVGVLTLTLNRPKALNALTPPLLKDLLKALKEAEGSKDVRCVILTGAGRAFCAGIDLADLKTREIAPDFSFGDEIRRWFNPVVLQIRKMEKPVIGALNGLAAGAGASLLLACDITLASEDANIISAFINIGLAPDSGMSWTLPRLMGRARALEHAWTAQPITAAAAAACGLINRAVPPYRLESEVLGLAGKLVKMPPRAVALTKRALNRSRVNSFEEQLEYEAQLQDILGRTADHKEGVSAFLDKRPPEFTGN